MPDKTRLLDKVDDDLWALCYQLHQLGFKARSRELAQANLSIIESTVLYILANFRGPLTPAEMSRLLLREPHSTSMLLQRMKRKGLITKTRNLHHKHLIRLNLTNEGRKAQKQTAEANTIHRIMSSLSEGDKKRLMTLLLKLREAAAREVGIKHDIAYP